MWQLTFALLLVASLTSADPQQGYDYLPPSIPFPTPCLDITQVVYSTVVASSVIPTTIRQYNTQYVTTTLYSQRIVPTTLYDTQYETRVQYQTSVVQKQTQVQREQVVTKTQQGYPVVNTKYETSIRVVPQVSYIVKEVVSTQVVPVEKVNTRYSTRYNDVVQYQTIPVQQTSVVKIPGKDVYSTAYDIKYQTSVVYKEQPAQTRYATTTRYDNRVETQTIPSPPVYSTKIAYSQRVVPTTLVRTQYQTQYVTRTEYATRTQYLTQTEVQTQYVPQEVLVTKDIPREVIRTEYRTQVIPTTVYQTRYETKYNTPYPVVVTQQSYYTSVVRVPGPDRYETKEVVQTQERQQVVYKTENIQRPVTVTKTVSLPCGNEGGGYKYPEPQNQFNY